MGGWVGGWVRLNPLALNNRHASLPKISICGSPLTEKHSHLISALFYHLRACALAHQVRCCPFVMMAISLIAVTMDSNGYMTMIVLCCMETTVVDSSCDDSWYTLLYSDRFSHGNKFWVVDVLFSDMDMWRTILNVHLSSFILIETNSPSLPSLPSLPSFRSCLSNFTSYLAHT